MSSFSDFNADGSYRRLPAVLTLLVAGADLRRSVITPKIVGAVSLKLLAAVGP